MLKKFNGGLSTIDDLTPSRESHPFA